MNKEQIFQLFTTALEIFYEKEKFLIDIKVSERALTHKLAEHLQGLFPCYDVDCEYNKVGDGDPKRLMELMYGNPDCLKDCDNCNSRKCVIFPDIIVHHRGIREDNLLVIEAKTKWSDTNANHDYEKLEALTESDAFQYQLGIAFRFSDNLKETLDSIVTFTKPTGTDVKIGKTF